MAKRGSTFMLNRLFAKFATPIMKFFFVGGFLFHIFKIAEMR